MNTTIHSIAAVATLTFIDSHDEERDREFQQLHHLNSYLRKNDDFISSVSINIPSISVTLTDKEEIGCFFAPTHTKHHTTFTIPQFLYHYLTSLHKPSNLWTTIIHLDNGPSYELPSTFSSVDRLARNSFFITTSNLLSSLHDNIEMRASRILIRSYQS